MLRLRHLRRRIARVMLVTLVMAALVPSLSRAAAYLQGDMAPWSVVCAAPDADAEAPAGTAHLLEHCPLCMWQADGPGLPPDLAPQAQPDALAHAVPSLFLRAPRPLHAWTPAQARAPPRPA